MGHTAGQTPGRGPPSLPGQKKQTGCPTAPIFPDVTPTLLIVDDEKSTRDESDPGSRLLPVTTGDGTNQKSRVEFLNAGVSNCWW